MRPEFLGLTVKIPHNLRCKSVKSILPAACNSRKKMAQSFFDDHPQQPANVADRLAQHGVQTVTVHAFEVAAIHPVVRFEVADDRVNGLPALEHLLFLLGQ